MSTTGAIPARSDQRPPIWTVWFRAIRFFSFTTSTVPILAASTLAIYVGDWNPLYFLLMLVASMATHAGCNLANDFYDDETGVDRVQRIGPSGVLQRGWLTRRDLGIGIAATFTIALVAALPIMIDLGTPIVVLAVVSAAAAFFYTGGPFPLAYWALGELTVFLAMGVGMVAGTFYVHTGTVSGASLLLGAAIGCLAAAILHANNIRDRDIDRVHRKRTIANLTGQQFARLEYRVLLLVPMLLVPLMVFLDPGTGPILIVFATIPKAAVLMKMVGGAESTHDLNQLLRRTAGLHMQVGFLLTVGYLAAWILEYL